MADQWAKIGISLILNVQENASFLANQGKRAFHAVVAGGAANTSDPDDVGPWYRCGSPRNFADLCNANADGVFDRMPVEPATVMRKEQANLRGAMMSKAPLSCTGASGTLGCAALQWA